MSRHGHWLKMTFMSLSASQEVLPTCGHQIVQLLPTQQRGVLPLNSLCHLITLTMAQYLYIIYMTFSFLLLCLFCGFCAYFLYLLCLWCSLCKLMHVCLFSAVCFLHGWLYFIISHFQRKKKCAKKRIENNRSGRWLKVDALLRTRWLLVPAPLLRLPCCASLLLQPVMKPLLFNLQTRQLVSHVQGDFSSVSVWIILLIFYCWSSRALLPAERWKQWGLPVNWNFYWLQPSSLT